MINNTHKIIGFQHGVRKHIDLVELIIVNGDAAESFRVNLWLKWSLFFSINESVSYLYRSAAEPAMCNHHLGLLFHIR